MLGPRSRRADLARADAGAPPRRVLRAANRHAAGPPADQRNTLSFRFDQAGRRMIVGGELDFGNCGVLANVMATLLDRHPGPIVVDVHELHVAEASGLEAFLASCAALGEQDAPVTIVGASLQARTACHSAGFDALLAAD
jgi:anti-anti-sigma regulatory factor